MSRMDLLTILLVILLAATGCTGLDTGSSHDNISSNGSLTAFNATSPGGAASSNQTAFAPQPLFPRTPADLKGKLLTATPFGSFEDSFIVSVNCTNESETYTTNYTFVSGTDGPHEVRLRLVPVNNMQDMKEIAMPERILNTEVEPAEFEVVPNHLYTIGVNITVGPDVVGYSHEFPGGGGVVYNPNFPFVLRVFVDGNPAPGADDQVTVFKICYFTPYSPNRPSPAIEIPEPEITMRAGEMKAINLTIRNFGGGIREIQYEAGGRLENQSYSFPLTAEERKPLPKGMNISISPASVTGLNFRSENQTLSISTTAGTPPGEYILPFVLCYRDLDLTDPASPDFPFSNQTICATMGTITVKVD